MSVILLFKALFSLSSSAFSLLSLLYLSLASSNFFMVALNLSLNSVSCEESLFSLLVVLDLNSPKVLLSWPISSLSSFIVSSDSSLLLLISTCSDAISSSFSSTCFPPPLANSSLLALSSSTSSSNSESFLLSAMFFFLNSTSSASRLASLESLSLLSSLLSSFSSSAAFSSSTGGTKAEGIFRTFLYPWHIISTSETMALTSSSPYLGARESRS
mmetsp:Transcript_19109/g.35484  ORF Transcript_19109/g.35484 Transcript_19109/m.35484 type:complete len:215 (-) Transcript_19109:983-1627(-)